MLIIRKSQAGDNIFLRKIVHQSLESFGIESDFEHLDYAVGMSGKADSPNIIELVASQNNVVCGCLVVSRLAQDEGKLNGFHVDAQFRGSGIGKMLLESAVIEAKRLGLKRLYLETWGNMHAAIHLYEINGWKREINPPKESGANRAYSLKLAV